MYFAYLPVFVYFVYLYTQILQNMMLVISFVNGSLLPHTFTVVFLI